MAPSRESSSHNPQLSSPTRLEVYEKGALLGSGANGAVYLYTNKVSKKKYACKVVSKFINVHEVVQHKIDVLFRIKDIKRNNLISIEEVIEDEVNWYIVMELCTGGSLAMHLDEGRIFTEFEAAKVVKEIMIGISACHKKGIVHRDMKLDNVVFESNLENSKVKIIDFGTSAYYNENEPLSDIVGIRMFSALEMYNDRAYGQM